MTTNKKYKKLLLKLNKLNVFIFSEPESTNGNAYGNKNVNDKRALPNRTVEIFI